MRAVCVEEGAADIDDILAAPGQNQIWFLRHDRERRCLQILLRRIGEELIPVLRRHDDRHALLGLGDGKLRSIKTLILFRNQVKIHPESVRKLSDRDGDTSRAEVIALLDHVRGLRPAEQTLQLPLRRRIALLDLRAAGGEGFHGMRLGCAGRAADAVPAGPPAEKDDDVARFRASADDRASRCRAEYGADLHTLCHIIRMINFPDMSGSKTDLVPIGGIAVSRLSYNLLLRQLALQCLGHRDSRICRACDTHGLIDVAAPGERIADRAAETGRRAAERLDLRRVVVGLVLEKHQPLLRLRSSSVVRLNRDDHGAGIVFLRLLHVGELPVGLEFFHSHERKVHEADILLRAMTV